MRQILLIDDLRTISVPDAEVVVARTAAEGLARIQERAWDSVFLDHDLGPGGDIRRSFGRLGSVRSTAIRPIKRVVVVTKNPVASDWMTKGLGRYYNVVGPGPLEILSSWA